MVQVGLPALVAVTAGAAAVELVARRAEPNMPHRGDWHDAIANLKDRQMRERVGARRRTDVVIAGSSQVLVGLWPGLAAGPDAYSAALHRGIPRVMERWVGEEVVPLLHPKKVIFGVSSPDLNDRGKLHIDVYERFRHSPALEKGPTAAMTLKAERISAAVRLRDELRHPSDLLRHVLRPNQAELAPVRRSLDTIAAAGESREYEHFTYRMSEKKAGFIREELGVDYTVGPIQTGAVRRTIEALQGDGIETIVVEMPVMTAFFDALPRGEKDHQDATNAMRDLAATTGSRYVDALAEVREARYYGDSVHLNGDGARLCSGMLARALSAST